MRMSTVGAILTLLACAEAPAGPLHPPQPARSATCQTTEITPPEAEILIYIMPASQTVRKTGRDVEWLMDSQAVSMDAYDGLDYHIFYVTFTGPTQGSSTVGYYAVNKHTADVLALVGEPHMLVASRELKGVEQILRRAHCISKETVAKYRYANPTRGGKRLTPEELCGHLDCSDK